MESHFRRRKSWTYPITMILVKDYVDDLVWGTYWYDSQNKPIKLEGHMDSDGTIYLSEIHGEGSTLSMKGVYSNGVFTGEWLLTKKKTELENSTQFGISAELIPALRSFTFLDFVLWLRELFLLFNTRLFVRYSEVSVPCRF